MKYLRVAPRDLFNEAMLLKCLGQLVIKLETVPFEHQAGFLQDSCLEWDIQQDASDGSIRAHALPFLLHLALPSTVARLIHPLNSREPYPLICVHGDDEHTEVFTPAGELSPEFLNLLRSA